MMDGKEKRDIGSCCVMICFNLSVFISLSLTKKLSINSLSLSLHDNLATSPTFPTMTYGIIRIRLSYPILVHRLRRQRMLPRQWPPILSVTTSRQAV